MNTQQFIRQIPFLAWVLMLVTLTFGLFGNFLGSLTPELSSDFNLTPKDIGYLMVAVSAGSGVGAFLGGDIAHRFRAAPLMLGYFAVIALSLLGIVFAPSFFWVCVFFFINSLTRTAVFTLEHSIVTMLGIADSLRPRMIALIDVGFSVGATLSPLWVTLFLIGFDNWRAPLWAFFLPLALVVFLLMRPQSFKTLANLTTVPTESNIGKASYLTLMTAPWARWAWICGILIGFVEWGQTYWFVIYASTDRGLDANIARGGLAAFTGGMLLIRIWQAFVHSHWSSEKRLKYLSILGCVMFVLLALMPRMTPAMLIYAVNFLAGVGIGVVFPLLLSQLIDHTPENTSKLSALLMLAIILGMQLAGLIVGYLAAHFSVQIGYSMMAVAMLGFTFGIWQMFKQIKTV